LKALYGKGLRGNQEDQRPPGTLDEKDDKKRRGGDERPKKLRG